jgi:hypothetical protein
MENQADICKEILFDFLDRWPVGEVRDDDSRPKQLIVAGQYKPNDDEVEFINYVKKNLNLNFSYENIDFD